MIELHANLVPVVSWGVKCAAEGCATILQHPDGGDLRCPDIENVDAWLGDEVDHGEWFELDGKYYCPDPYCPAKTGQLFYCDPCCEWKARSELAPGQTVGTPWNHPNREELVCKECAE